MKDKKRTIQSLLESGRKSRFVPREFDLLGEGNRHLAENEEKQASESVADFASAENATNMATSATEKVATTATGVANFAAANRADFAIAKSATTSRAPGANRHAEAQAAANFALANGAMANFAPAKGTADIASNTMAEIATGAANRANLAIAENTTAQTALKNIQEGICFALQQKLHPTLFVTYIYLCYHQNTYGLSQLGLSEIAAGTGLAKRTVQENIKELLQHGLIEIKRQHPTATAYYAIR